LLDKPNPIVDIEVTDFPLENQVLLNEHDNRMTNELSSEVLTKTGMDHPKISAI